ncbi:Hypothetical predicted protein [Olea europaea subsp. europaea]|uniref:Uncharacterized protein n=1 Tax=Olea europaea subsp. europaea TaxID=158383 RepID=A0A8S0UQB2_OLEEU|nr:Hypothetical predicted protein [Olea europaea subsp. europaea]
MSSTDEEMAPRRTRERLDEEVSSQSAPIIQESLPAAPVVCHQRGGSRTRPKLESYSRAITSNSSASVFDRLGPTRTKRDRLHILPTQARLPPILLSQPHPFDPPSMGGQHGQPQSKAITKLTSRYMHHPPRKRRERQATLARMRAN